MIIQVYEHRRAHGGCHEKVFELAENTRADRRHLIGRSQPSVSIFAPEYIEVVVPKIAHHFVELTLAVGGADDLLRSKLFQKSAWQLETTFGIQGLDAAP